MIIYVFANFHISLIYYILMHIIIIYNYIFFLFQKQFDPFHEVLIYKLENTVEVQSLLLKQQKYQYSYKKEVGVIIFLMNPTEMHQLMVGMGGPVGMPSTGIHASEVVDAGLNPTKPVLRKLVNDTEEV